jgi:Glu-tRNA(Gln) amidotransferase subunit E-like FAD-binding protein
MKDYKELQFKCGIEIHQQLDTRKLFCNCASIVHDEYPDIFFERKLRAVIGETGKVDAAAAHEQSKGKLMKYEACSTSSCLVEMDEEPPHPMNQEALAVVLQVAKMLHAKIVDEIQVMRKTVVDGSNVGGFQRTALVAIDGYIETSKGRVSIPTVCIEEEAAKKIEDTYEYVKFRLDRLGVPLIEIATDPDIIDPEHAQECAEQIGMILRSTGKVKRGIGTIRQDVNVSILGKARVEIKGFQDLRSIPAVIDGEIDRQKKLYDNNEGMDAHVRKANSDGTTTFMRPMPGAARMYPETDVTPIIPEIQNLDDIELLSDKAGRFEKEYALSTDLAKVLVKCDECCLFEECVKEYPDLKPAFIAETLISVPKEIRRKEKINLENIMDEHFKELFGYISEGKVAKESVMEIIIAMNKGKFDISQYAMVSDDELKKEVQKIVDSMNGKPFGAVMGEVMKHFRGKVDGKKASELIKGFM